MACKTQNDCIRPVPCVPLSKCCLHDVGKHQHNKAPPLWVKGQALHPVALGLKLGQHGDSDRAQLQAEPGHRPAVSPRSLPS